MTAWISERMGLFHRVLIGWKVLNRAVCLQHSAFSKKQTTVSRKGAKHAKKPIANNQ